jgi:hypothetical protein
MTNDDANATESSLSDEPRYYSNGFVISVILGILSLELNVLLFVRRQLGYDSPSWLWVASYCLTAFSIWKGRDALREHTRIKKETGSSIQLTGFQCGLVVILMVAIGCIGAVML